MGKNIYKGNRYVPLIMGVWDNKREYEPLSIVLWEGNSHTSKKYVPIGIDINNTEFWVVSGNYNAQVEKYRQETQAVATKLTGIETDTLKNKSDIELINGDLVNIDNNITSINGDLVVINNDITTIEQDVNNLTNNTTALENEVNKVKNNTPTPYQANFYKKGTREKEYGFIIPNLSLKESPVIQVDSAKFTDGAKFISVVNVEGVLTNPLDKFYGYVASHDGLDIYLFTAPTPEGVWTFRQSVKNVSNSPFTDHISSPSVLVHNNKIYMYYHGWDTTTATQPTALATSLDGINFTDNPKFPIINTHNNHKSKFYGHSTSYARVIKYNNMFIAVFQANSDMNNYQTTYATVGVGCAISTDGINFRVMKKPLIGNIPLKRGCFGPELIRLFDKWLLLYTDMETLNIKGCILNDLEYDNYYELGEIIPYKTGTWDISKIEAQSSLFYGNKLYLYYAGWDSANFGRIGLATIDLGVI